MCCFIMGHTLLSHSSFVRRDVGGLNFISQIGLGFDGTMITGGWMEELRRPGRSGPNWAYGLLYSKASKSPKTNYIYIYRKTDKSERVIGKDLLY